MVDQTKFVTLAKKLIEADGRTFTFARRDPVPPDPAKPWIVNPVEPDPGANRFDAIGVAIDYTDRERENSLIEADDIKILIAAASLTQAIKEDMIIIDGTAELSIVPPIKKIQPGTVLIMYELQARR